MLILIRTIEESFVFSKSVPTMLSAYRLCRGTACACRKRPAGASFSEFRDVDGLPLGDVGIQRWLPLKETDVSALKGWTFFETSKIYYYGWPFSLIYRHREIHLTIENADLSLSRNLTQYYEGKAYYTMHLPQAEVFLRPLYLQLKVKDKKRKYTFGFHDVKEYFFFVKSIKVQIQDMVRQKEQWLCNRIFSLHRSCAAAVRQKTHYCDDTLYDLIRESLKKKNPVLIDPITGKTLVHQNVYCLQALARGWSPHCCVCIAISSRCRNA